MTKPIAGTNADTSVSFFHNGVFVPITEHHQIVFRETSQEPCPVLLYKGQPVEGSVNLIIRIGAI